jgi:FkbM family methyltransferase
MYDFMDAIAANPDLLTDVPITPGGVALDLGAFEGDWTARMVDRHRCTVYAFEPSPAIAAKTAARFEADPDVTVFAYGVGANDRTARLARDGPGSSLLRREGAFGSVDVLVRDIVGVLDDLGLCHLDVVKMNIEGAEYDVLERLIAADWFDRIGTLSVQFHEWAPGAYRRRKRIRAALRRSHVQVWSYGWVWELWCARGLTPRI